MKQHELYPQAPARISQVPGDSPDYNPGIWGPHSSDSGCAVACVSMALSCIGIYKTPKEIVEAQDGSNTVVWERHGIFSSYPHTIAGLHAALANWRSNPDVYAPPIVRVIDISHFVVVIGINSNGDFNVVDPATWNPPKTYSTPYQIIQYHK